MNLFLILLLIAATTGLAVRLIRRKVAKHDKPKNVRTPRVQRKDQSMQTSIGVKSNQTVNPVSNASTKSARVKTEPTLASSSSHTHNVPEIRAEKSSPDNYDAYPEQQTQQKQTTKRSRSSDDLISLIVVAPKAEPFSGYELLQSILARGMRLGSDRIFHRHENENGTGEELYHLAAATKEGLFDLPNMGAFSCPGLVFYMELGSYAAPLKAFECMLDAAHGLAEELGGCVLDQTHRELTLETVGLIKQHISRSASVL